MARITNAMLRIRETGQAIKADCFGNNASIECPGCHNYPILLVALPNQRGCSVQNPAVCRSCGCRVAFAEIPNGEQIAVLDLLLID